MKVTHTDSTCSYQRRSSPTSCSETSESEISHEEIDRFDCRSELFDSVRMMLSAFSSEVLCCAACGALRLVTGGQTHFHNYPSMAASLSLRDIVFCFCGEKRCFWNSIPGCLKSRRRVMIQQCSLTQLDGHLAYRAKQGKWRHWFCKVHVSAQ